MIHRSRSGERAKSCWLCEVVDKAVPGPWSACHQTIDGFSEPILDSGYSSGRAGRGGVDAVVDVSHYLEACPYVVGGEEDVIVGVCAGAAGVGYFDDLVVGVAVWDGAGPGCYRIFSCCVLLYGCGGRR
jgi:hypothetical protein